MDFDEEELDETPSKVIDPLDSLLSGVEGSQLPPIAPDGGFSPAIGEPFKIPDAIPENFICLRGPCHYYMESIMVFGAGNTRDSLPREPLLVTRRCLRIPGYEIDLSDELVRDCNRFDPMSPEEVSTLEVRRNRYYQANPNIVPFKIPNGKEA